MASTDLATKNSYQQTSNNPLANTVTSIVAAMTADFGDMFKRTFSSDEELRQLKRRLYVKLKGLPVSCIVDGYEELVLEKPSFLPTVPEIVGKAIKFEKIDRQKKKNAQEALLLEHKKHNQEPKADKERVLNLLSDAMHNPRACDKEKNYMEKLRKKHKEYLETMRSIVPYFKRQVQPHHECAVGYCSDFGALSHSVNGGSNFYCLKHYEEKAS